MRQLAWALAALLVLTTAPARSQDADPISAMIAEQGLAGSLSELSSLPEPTPTQSFALGGVRFLHAIEQALQTRWRYGAAAMPDYIPILRLELPPNPAADAADDTMVAQIFTEANEQMLGALEALDAIPDGTDPGLVIDLADIWFDVNMNGTREPFEGLLAITSAALNNAGSAPTGTRIRFDAADVAWLQAYAHLLAGVGNIVLAFDTATAIGEVRQAGERASAMQFDPSPYVFYMPDSDRWLDLLAIQIKILRQQPDPARTRAARAHLLSMVAANRVFWQRLAEETDNEAEWIPGPGQTSALGFVLPEGIGDVWMAVLIDLEKMLNGELLISHWRYGGAFGINAAKFLEDPAPLDLIGWIHGMDALDYMEPGPTLSSLSWRSFEQLVGRQGFLFVILLN